MNKIIRFGEPIEKVPSVAPLPPTVLHCADSNLSDREPFLVFFVDDVHEQILKHLGETPDIESGGILVGYPFKTPNEQTTYVIISGAIPQRSEERSAVHFTVGPKENQAVREELERTYPGQIAVGWYHSHPGHGIFLSSQDMEIVRSIYNASWNVALVVDTIHHEEGLFWGPKGRQLGEKDGHEIGRVWKRLSGVPENLRLVSLINRANEAIQEANDRFFHIMQLIASSDELKFWHDSAELRQLEMQLRLASTTVLDLD